MNKKEKPNYEKPVSDFCDSIKQAISDYEWNKEEVKKLDLLTQDYLHKLELEKLSYADRAKLATKISKCRRKRRESKDTVEILTPMIEFLNSDKGKNYINMTKEVLGKIRKVERGMETRVYRHKVLSDDDIY